MRFRSIAAVFCYTSAVGFVGSSASAQDHHLSKQREYAVAYQINPAHSGSITFTNGFKPPLTTLWSEDFGYSNSGFTYPLIADGKLYVVTYGNDVYAFDMQSGATVWEHLFSGSGYQAAYDRGILFLTDSTGRVTALDARNGKQKWSVLPSGATSSNAAAPIAIHGTVIVADAVNQSGSGIFGLEEATGHQLWWNIAGSSGASTPAYGDGGAYLSFPCNYYKFSALDGSQVWHTTSTGDCYGYSSTPSYYQHRLYVHDASNYVLDSATGDQMGTYPGLPTPAFFKASNHRSYEVTTANGRIYCVDVKKGTVAWSYGPDDGVGDALPIIINGIVLAMTEGGNLIALDGQSGTELWSGPVGAYGSSSYLAAGEGIVAVSSGSTLTVLAPK